MSASDDRVRPSFASLSPIYTQFFWPGGGQGDALGAIFLGVEHAKSGARVELREVVDGGC
jgi:hypothetical protein